MWRIRWWLYALLVPIVFFGGCTSSIPYVWSFVERFWVQDADSSETHFPVLVVSSIGRYSAAIFADIPAGSTIALSNFNEAKINRDLNGAIGGNGAYPYFQVVSTTPTTTSVSLELPTTHDAKLKAWYDIKGGAISPTKILHYGPGFAFVVMPWNFAAGLACVAMFTFVFRPRPARRTTAQ